MKFEMNRYTLDKLMSLEYVTINIGLVEHKYLLLGYPVVINTDKPDGIVQLGRDTVDLTYTDNIRGSLESLVYAAKRREGGRIHFGPGGSYSIPVTKEEDEAFNSMTRDSGVATPPWARWNIGDEVTKIKGSSWTGKVVGYYRTELTPNGYAVESNTEKGSVQIYPEAALKEVKYVK